MVKPFTPLIKKRNCGLGASSIAALALFFHATVEAAPRPHWAGQMVTNGIPANESFLSDTDKTPKEQNTIFPAKVARELRQQYEDLTRDYEFRRKYDLVDPEAERAHIDRMKDFSRGIFDEIQRYELRKGRHKLEAAAYRDENLKNVAGPLIAAGVIAAACTTGDPLEVALSDETRLTSRTNIPASTQKLAISSPVLSGTVDFLGKDPGPNEEKYRFSLLRGIPVVNVTSGVAYAGTSNTVNLSLSKEIVDNVTCVLDSSRPVASGSAGAQDTLKVLYGIRF